MAVLLLKVVFCYLCSVFVFVILSFLFLAGLVVTCWEMPDLLAPMYVDFYYVYVTFPHGVLCQVWYLIVSIPDLCLLPFFGISCGVLLLLEGGPYQCF